MRHCERGWPAGTEQVGEVPSGAKERRKKVDTDRSNFTTCRMQCGALTQGHGQDMSPLTCAVMLRIGSRRRSRMLSNAFVSGLSRVATVEPCASAMVCMWKPRLWGVGH